MHRKGQYILHKCEEYKVIESIQYDSINFVRLMPTNTYFNYVYYL